MSPEIRPYTAQTGLIFIGNHDASVTTDHCNGGVKKAGAQVRKAFVDECRARNQSGHALTSVDQRLAGSLDFMRKRRSVRRTWQTAQRAKGIRRRHVADVRA